MEKKGTKIIIIDDDSDTVDSLKSFLGDKYYVEGYTKSKDGLKRVKDFNFDILVIDYYIDDLNADTIVEEIRKTNNNIYILLLTGYKEKVSGLKSLESMNIQSYCEKTADFEAIVVCIESAVKSIEFFQTQKYSIGERIRELRKHYNMSQDDVAKHLNVQRTAISSYESGDSIPPTLTVIKLADLFKVTTDYILCHEIKIK